MFQSFSSNLIFNKYELKNKFGVTLNIITRTKNSAKVDKCIITNKFKKYAFSATD